MLQPCCVPTHQHTNRKVNDTASGYWRFLEQQALPAVTVCLMEGGVVLYAHPLGLLKPRATTYVCIDLLDCVTGCTPSLHCNFVVVADTGPAVKCSTHLSK